MIEQPMKMRQRRLYDISPKLASCVQDSEQIVHIFIRRDPYTHGYLKGLCASAANFSDVSLPQFINFFEKETQSEFLITSVVELWQQIGAFHPC